MTDEPHIITVAEFGAFLATLPQDYEIGYIDFSYAYKVEDLTVEVRKDSKTITVID